MPTLPTNLSYGTVTARFLLAYIDSADVDTDPDAVAPTGTVTFTPSATYIKNVTASPSPTVVVPSSVTCFINSDGYLYSLNGNSVKLLATDDPDTAPVDWTWQASFNFLDRDGVNIGNLPSFNFSLPGGTTVDLANVAPMPASNGVFYLKGDAPDLSIGSVTTGDAGSSADVTITGTVDAPILNFTIPRGDTGATGSLSGLSSTAPITYISNTIGLADVSPSPAGTYGSSTVVPAITVDAKGRVTSVTNQTITAGSSYGTLNNYRAYPTGYYYTAPGGYLSAANSLATHDLTFMPFYVSQTTTFTKIAVYVETGVAACVVRAGIYTPNATTDLPATRLYETPTSLAATTSATKVEWTGINQTLTPGLYWLAAVTQTTKSSLTTFERQIVPLPNIPWTFLGTYTPGIKQTGVTGSLPATPTLTLGQSATYVVWLGL